MRRRRMARRIVVFLLVGLLAGFTALTAQVNGLDSRLDIELKDADVGQTLQSFGTIVKADRVEIDPAISGTVTITVHGVRAETALTAVCESVGCVWSFEDGALRIEPAENPSSSPEAKDGADPLEEPIDLVLNDADLRQVLQAFGQIAGIAVEIAPEVKGTVTVEINQTPAREVLDRLCAVQHCTWEVVEGEEGPLLRVGPE